MAKTTEASERVSREEVSTYLRQLADEFEDDDVRVTVGNKQVTLDPPGEVKRDVEVVERSSKLRGDREMLEITLSWKVE